MNDLRTIATVRKNNTQEIRISVSIRDGYALVDMRVFEAPRRAASGEPHPTAAGICLTRTKLPELIQALQAAEREVSR
ncbi:hypothetical protein [Methylobacterium bullatum]|uniref:Transcriptional coactivator p15 (PC4) C-terminal domain-containing protein n=1 Tax=Methylobacterium bullatum TaxID=570505 RepID=A0AAV4Z7G9_9HYPH|nr:hypothetical protein [Methylobacterium bullatum]MBD8901404.1 hypothetical protein [Methylobacterium bullatum]GJD40099.1 hypothetical protein OICFNHDK_2564 [Methylobacterium bullatum]